MNKSIIILFVAVSFVLGQGVELKLKSNSKLSHSSYFIENGYSEIPLLKFNFGHYLVSVTINNCKYWFLLDTGANGCCIKKDIADSLKLRKLKLKAIQNTVDNQDIISYVCITENIKIGEFKIDSLKLVADNKAFYNVINVVNRLKNNPKNIRNENVEVIGGTYNEFVGIIGDDLLSKYNAVIDLYNMKLYLK